MPETLNNPPPGSHRRGEFPLGKGTGTAGHVPGEARPLLSPLRGQPLPGVNPWGPAPY